MFFSSFALLFFLLQMIAIIFDDAIYLFIYFLHFISMLLRPSPILKTIQKMGERNENKTTLQQQTNNYHTSNELSVHSFAVLTESAEEEE